MFRVIIYAFVIIDMTQFVNDVIPHGYVPELYQPTLLARLIHLPPLGVTGAWVLFWVITAACITAILGKLQRTAGWVVAIGFFIWMLNSQGFSYVQHDHLALMITVAVLPTVGTARLLDTRTSQAAGWALRSVQVSVILTYFGSAFAKWSRTGSPQAWANGAVFVWAIMRRGSDMVRWTLEYPKLLIVAQWGLITLEFLSPIVLFLRKWWLYLAVAVFLSFHLATYLALEIHFLPTVVCWAAFLPLERLPAWVNRVFRRMGKGPVRS